jgi:hypothetical protein
MCIRCADRNKGRDRREDRREDRRRGSGAAENEVSLDRRDRELTLDSRSSFRCCCDVILGSSSQIRRRGSRLAARHIIIQRRRPIHPLSSSLALSLSRSLALLLSCSFPLTHTPSLRGKVPAHTRSVGTYARARGIGATPHTAHHTPHTTHHTPHTQTPRHPDTHTFVAAHAREPYKRVRSFTFRFLSLSLSLSPSLPPSRPPAHQPSCPPAHALSSLTLLAQPPTLSPSTSRLL